MTSTVEQSKQREYAYVSRTNYDNTTILLPKMTENANGPFSLGQFEHLELEKINKRDVIKYVFVIEYPNGKKRRKIVKEDEFYWFSNCFITDDTDDDGNEKSVLHSTHSMIEKKHLQDFIRGFNMCLCVHGHNPTDIYLASLGPLDNIKNHNFCDFQCTVLLNALYVNMCCQYNSPQIKDTKNDVQAYMLYIPPNKEYCIPDTLHNCIQTLLLGEVPNTNCVLRIDEQNNRNIEKLNENHMYLIPPQCTSSVIFQNTMTTPIKIMFFKMMVSTKRKTNEVCDLLANSSVAKKSHIARSSTSSIE